MDDRQSSQRYRGKGNVIRYLVLVLVLMLCLLLGCGGETTSTHSAGDTWTRPADSAVMVYVPAGEFLMGSTENDPDARDEEKPVHTVDLDAFWIDKTEVTNAQYRKCVEAGACEEPGCGNRNDVIGPSQPVVCVSWDDAQAYASWVGGRLPTEAEWEKAARGTDGRTYPWGDSAPDCNRANYSDCGRAIADVGSYPEGASPYGVLDMAGNAWEWVADWYAEDYYSRSPARNPQGPDSGDRRVQRGGSFDWGQARVRCAYRIGSLPAYSNWDLGFRVVAAGPSQP
jgi:formylglycine-generating enzyme required for sulfatase activity